MGNKTNAHRLSKLYSSTGPAWQETIQHWEELFFLSLKSSWLVQWSMLIPLHLTDITAASYKTNKGCFITLHLKKQNKTCH